MSGSMTPAERLRAAADHAFWRSLAPRLHVAEPGGAVPAAGTLAPAPELLEREVTRLRRDGWASVERVVPAELCARLVAALQCLQDAHIPTPFLYVYDEAWQIAAGLAPTFDALVGGQAWLWPDVWAWLLPARAGVRGWTPHRGVGFDVRDAEGAPTLVNAWVALSDVPLESACMHVVPLGADPHYPHALDRVDVDRNVEAAAVALPVPAGSLLAWNANVLHWGGAMSDHATTARASLSFTVARGPGPAGAGRFLPTDPPAFEARVDLVADMLLTYEAADRTREESQGSEWLEWAKLAQGMRVMRAPRLPSRS
jgi:hypothetical protein